MSSRRNSPFSSVQTEGGLLPQDLLSRIQSGDKTLDGAKPESYHLAPHERVGEAVNRAWTRLTALWHGFQEALASQPDSALATGLTRDRWLLPLFQELGYGRLPKGQAIEADDKRFAVSHSWQHSPIHLLGVGVDLDRRQAGVAGAAKASPHGLVQEFLNRSEHHLWGFVSNGLRLRILRDHHSLTRQAYVEFDLQAIMEGEQYSEFLLLWMVCHQSRVEADKPADCWLEQWFNTSRQEGVRALDKLRAGVEQAIAAFGTGFVAHRANTRLHDALASGELDKQEYYRQVLRLVYRLIFLFVAEGRDALLDPQADAAARDRYLRFYATGCLRELADKRRGGAHGDLWQGLRLIMSKLHDGCPELALPALGSALWGPAGCPWLMDAECGNEHVLDAVRRLSNIQDGKTRYPVNWRNVGADELGSIYEGLLELHPRINKEAGTFELASAAGHERKTTGSYYTPTELVDCLLDSALDPVVDEACRKTNPEAAILDLKVCDPACGSGHFLVAAARRIAKRLAGVRAGEDEPSPNEVQRALRDVVGRCIYGVDINPMAVELCKVSLWMEAIEPGRPLSFLDSHIQCGNALLGATPALMARGIPNDAFKPIEGDDKEVAKRLKKRNAAERKSRQLNLALPPPLDAPVVSEFMACDQSADSDLAAVREHESCWLNLQQSNAYRDAKFRADAWCAAFVWPKEPGELGSAAITQEVWRQLQSDASTASAVMRRTVRELARHYQFFHWHLAFPQVFDIAPNAPAEGGERGRGMGFDIVLGNPPYLNVDDTWGKGHPRLHVLQSWYPNVYSDKTDLLYYFLARGAEVSSGRLGMLLSRAFIEAHKAQKLRGYLANRSQVVELIDFQDHRVFPGVGLIFAVLTLDCGQWTGPATIRRARPGYPRPEALPGLRFNAEYFEIFTVPNTDIDGDSWTFAAPEFRHLVDKIDASGTSIGDFMELGQGMQTGRNDVFSITKDQVEAWNLPDSMYRIRVSNSDIRRYRLTDSGKRLVYVEGIVKFEDLPEPVGQHLQSKREKLEERAACKRGNCDWWRYTWPLHAEKYDRLRLLSPYMSKDNHFALDATGKHLGLTDTTVVFDSGQPEDIRWILAALNSRVLTFRYAFVGKLKEGGKREYFWNGIGKLPMPRIDFSSSDEKSLHDVVVALVEQRYAGDVDGHEALEIEARIEVALALGAWDLLEVELALILDTLPYLAAENTKEFGDYRFKNLVLEQYRRCRDAIDAEQSYLALLAPTGCPDNPPSASPVKGHR